MHYTVYSLHTGAAHIRYEYLRSQLGQQKKNKTEKFIYFFVGVPVFNARRASHNDYLPVSIELPVLSEDCVCRWLPCVTSSNAARRTQKLNCRKVGNGVTSQIGQSGTIILERWKNCRRRRHRHRRRRRQETKRVDKRQFVKFTA